MSNKSLYAPSRHKPGVPPKPSKPVQDSCIDGSSMVNALVHDLSADGGLVLNRPVLNISRGILRAGLEMLHPVLNKSVHDVSRDGAPVLNNSYGSTDGPPVFSRSAHSSSRDRPPALNRTVHGSFRNVVPHKPLHDPSRSGFPVPCRPVNTPSRDDSTVSNRPENVPYRDSFSMSSSSVYGSSRDGPFMSSIYARDPLSYHGQFTDNSPMPSGYAPGPYRDGPQIPSGSAPTPCGDDSIPSDDNNCSSGKNIDKINLMYFCSVIVLQKIIF